MIDALKKIVGDAHVMTAADDVAPYFKEYSGRYTGNGLAVVRPANTQQVAEVVRCCAAHGVPIVPQGGNTGLVGGSVPYDGKAIVISLSRMNAIRSIDADNFSMVVEAGCVLEKLQQAASDVQRYFPLALAAQGSCTIGGNIATNAGGILTIRYGNTRDLVLGLEVVLPNGDIWDGLRSLRKDNTGYNLKHLFIGSEGTLGIITAAVLKLYPDPGQRQTVFVSTDTLENVIALLSHLRGTFGENIQAFELITKHSAECAIAHNPQCVAPMAMDAPYYVLVEIAGGKNNDNFAAAVEDALAGAFEKNILNDALIAQNEQQRRVFWVVRESASDGAQAIGSIKHDISVPVSKIPEFVREANMALERLIPGIRAALFGHAGDGNLHFDMTPPIGMDEHEFQSRWSEVNHVMHDVVQKYNGSIAAEHGIGTFKPKELAQRKSPVEMDMMRKLKRAIDPQNIMNPGKVLE